MPSRRRGASHLLASVVAAVVVFSACASPEDESAVKATEPPAEEDQAPGDVLTFQYDRARTGVASRERILKPANVNAATFGKTFSLAVDGHVYAQPLYVHDLVVGGQARDVLFVATQHDSVYAFDGSGSPREPLWHVALLGDGETPVPAKDTLSRDIYPEVGITGTPVIDREAGLLYVVARAKRPDGTHVQRLHALRLASGSEAAGGPVDVAAQVPGTASDAVDGKISFEPLHHNQRAALALVDGRVFIAWASHSDKPPYHGWLLGYDASALTTPPMAWMTTPDGLLGGIWMGANGPSADAEGNLYVASGNGSFGDEATAPAVRTNFGLSALKLRVEADHVAVSDWFSPVETQALNADDLDFGSIGALVLPDQPGPIPHRVLAGAKTGMVYVLNRDDMGQHQADVDRVVQRFWIGTRFFTSNVAFFKNVLYVCPHKSSLAAYRLDRETGLFDEEPASQAPTCTGCFVRGGTPSVSANGDKDAIVWVLDNTAVATAGPAIVHAYDASDVSRVLYDSSSSEGGRDAAAPAVKFTMPMVANGRVYVGGQNAVTVYGLLVP